MAGAILVQERFRNHLERTKLLRDGVSFIIKRPFKDIINITPL